MDEETASPNHYSPSFRKSFARRGEEGPASLKGGGVTRKGGGSMGEVFEKILGRSVGRGQERLGGH